MTKANISWNINQITKGMTNGTIRFDNAIQRGYVWDKKRASLLIDSVLREYPIPPIFTIKTEEKITVRNKEVSVYDCIDGKQRSTTFKMFIENEFALTGLEPIILADGSEVDINGLTFEELDEEMQDAIKSYTLTVYYFSDITDEEIAEMMSRLNNGMVLTGTENARIKAKCLPEIQELASHDLFMNYLTEKAIKGYANEDIVLKLALLLNEQTELSTKNVRNAYETFTFGESINKSIMDTLDFTFETIEEATDDKKILKNIFKKANIITVLYVAHEYMINEDANKDLFGEKLVEFFNGKNGTTISDDYNEACKNATMRSANVITRYDELWNYIVG